MIHLHEQARTDPVDVAALRTLTGPVLDALRALDVTTEGVRTGPDQPRRGAFRLVRGDHPRPGATYRLTEHSSFEYEGEPVERTQETDIEVLADLPDRVQIQIRQRSSKQTVAVTIEPPTRPTTITVDVFGPVEADVVIDLEHVPVSASPQVELTALHRFGAAEATVAVTVDATGPAERWRWDLRVEARGRSIARPLVSLAWLLTRRKVRAQVTQLLGESVGQGVAPINELLAELTADGSSPDAAARRAVAAWVEQLPAD